MVDIFSLVHSSAAKKALVLDCDIVRQRVDMIRTYLPLAKPYYAIKSNNNIDLLRTLKSCGVDFDVATENELKLLHSIDPEWKPNFIHTHPIKNTNNLAYCGDTKFFVVDNYEEAVKVQRMYPRMDICIRISFDNPNVKINLSRKFGVTTKNFHRLYTQCVELGLNVVAVSFHVGSQSPTPDAHINAIKQTTKLLNGTPITLIDIGGGFPVNYDGTIDEVAYLKSINDEIAMHCDYEFICEPGRFISGPSMVAISMVEGVNTRSDDNGNEVQWIYINDGVYGSYSGVIYDHQVINPTLIVDGYRPTLRTYITGPTCDSIDMIAQDIEMPQAKIGDLLVSRNMGAYSQASASNFNMVESTPIIVLNS